MNAHTRTLLAAAAVVGLLLTAGCRAEGTPEPSPNAPSSSGLVEQPKEYDGARVTFRGEAVGEAMKRGEMAWVHINDDPYYLKNVEEGAQLGGYNSGMAVWLPADEARQITYFGDYEHEGDIVEVAGVFNAACAEHGGDTDIHADGLTVVESGHAVVDPVHTSKVLWAVALSVLAAALYALTRFQAHPHRVTRR